MENSDDIGKFQSCVLAAPYSINCRLNLAQAYERAQYPDLAAGEAYLALLLIDEVEDESSEYYEHTITAMKHALSAGYSGQDNIEGDMSLESSNQCNKSTITEDILLRKLGIWSSITYSLLSQNLLECGSLQNAYRFCKRGLRKYPDNLELQALDETIKDKAERYCSQKGIECDNDEDFDIDVCPEVGLVRREIYPWNDHEPNKLSEESLDSLNNRLSEVGPKLTVGTVDMPILPTSTGDLKCNQSEKNNPTWKQLGLFAKEDLMPGEIILKETSLLTANARLYDSFCDACGGSLHISSANGHLDANLPFACPDCDDSFFCSESCFKLASTKYHPAICGKDIEAIIKETSASEAPNLLYSLLLLRSFALAATQDRHPLDVPEVKFLWGDYINHQAEISKLQLKPHCTLPFSFQMNIFLPFHMLQKMDINIFESFGRYDTWVFNTLYAKFRGTASARQGLDGKPEISAVHPMWCLANHSCDPNVTWEWGGLISFAVRKQRVKWAGEENAKKAGIRKGEEVLSHYCDITLPVRERREWAFGALGGQCMCERCRWEASMDKQEEA